MVCGHCQIKTGIANFYGTAVHGNLMPNRKHQRQCILQIDNSFLIK